MPEPPNLDAARRALAETTRSLAQQVVPLPPGPQFKIAEVTAVSGSDISVDFGDGTPVDNLSFIGGTLTVGDIALVLVDPPIATVIGAVDGGAGGGGGGGTNYWESALAGTRLQVDATAIPGMEEFYVFFPGENTYLYLADFGVGSRLVQLVSQEQLEVTAGRNLALSSGGAYSADLFGATDVNIAAQGGDVTLQASDQVLLFPTTSCYINPGTFFQVDTGTNVDINAGTDITLVAPSGMFVTGNVEVSGTVRAAETYVAASVSGAINVSLNSRVHQLTMTGNITITFTNLPGSGKAVGLTLYLVQDGTGGRLVTWPASVKWAGGVPPILSVAANAVDLVVMETFDGGTTWYANLAGLGYA